MLSISSLIAPRGANSYYTKAWRNLVEDHIEYLRNHPDTALVEVKGIASYHSRYDFYAVLTVNKIPEFLHWTILRVNGYSKPSEFNEETKSFLLPPQEVIAKLNKLVATS